MEPLVKEINDAGDKSWCMVSGVKSVWNKPSYWTSLYVLVQARTPRNWTQRQTRDDMKLIRIKLRMAQTDSFIRHTIPKHIYKYPKHWINIDVGDQIRASLVQHQVREDY